MSNKITFTFDGGTSWSAGQTFTLSQIDIINSTSNLIWEVISSAIPQPFKLPFVPIAPTPEEQNNINANAFKVALERDLNNSLYSVTITNNVVVVTALTQEFAFENAVSTFGGVTIVVDFTPLQSTLQRIHARNPYFISAPVFDGDIKTITSAKFDIYIYEGVLNTSKPSTPTSTYEKKPRFEGDTNIYIDISRQISDYIDNKYNGTLQTDCVFVEVETTSTYSGGTISQVNKFLALNGYNLHSQNVNHIPQESILLSNSTISVLSGELIYLPFYLGSGNVFEVTVTLKDGSFFTIQVDDLEIINTNEVVRYVEITDTENVAFITIFNANTFEQVVFDVEVVTECIYDPVKITFVNRFGVLQDFYTYKVSKETIKATNDSYNRSILQEDLIGGIPVLSYQPTEHRKREYNRQATKSIELNTGYIPEDNNIIIEEMLTSEYIWLTIDGVIIPANLSTKSVPLLTRINDQLIKYKLNFDFSYNEVQNIR